MHSESSEEEETDKEANSVVSGWIFVALAVGLGLIFVGAIITVLAASQGNGSGSAGVLI